MTLRAVALLLAMLAMALLGGCLGGQAPRDPAAPAAEPAQADTSTYVPLAPAPADGRPGEVWVATACSVGRFTINQDEESASAGLPPDARPSGGVTAEVVVLLADCEALVRGNSSVVRPFQWAITFTSLLPSDPGTSEGFAREMVMSDPAAAQALRTFGFPAEPGNVAIAGDGIREEASVQADGLDYALQWPASPGEGSLQSAATHTLRGGDDARSFWMTMDIQRSGRATASMPGVATATGGYLGSALPAGSAPGLMDHATETWTLTFGEAFPGA